MCRVLLSLSLFVCLLMDMKEKTEEQGDFLLFILESHISLGGEITQRQNGDWKGRNMLKRRKAENVRDWRFQLSRSLLNQREMSRFCQIPAPCWHLETGRRVETCSNEKKRQEMSEIGRFHISRSLTELKGK